MFSLLSFETAAAWLLLLLTAVILGNALRTGEIRVYEIRYRRVGQSSAYWFEIVAAALTIVVAAALLSQLPRHPDPYRRVNPIEILWAVILMRFVAQALWHGRARFFGSDYPRTAGPREYWTIVLVAAVLCGGMTWLILDGLARHGRA